MKNVVDVISRNLVDDGLLIQGGWEGFKCMVYPNGMTADQEEALRIAFFAGAQHIFGSVICMLDDEDMPTETDMRRMQSIHDELEKFIAEFRQKHGIN